MRIVFIETSGLTNDLLRAVARAAPNCVGYPDGVPESWRDKPAAVASQWESDGGPIDMGVLTVGVSSTQRVLEMPGKHPICETRGGAGGGATFPDHELDPAALLGPVTEPVDWPDERGDDEC